MPEAMKITMSLFVLSIGLMFLIPALTKDEFLWKCGFFLMGASGIAWILSIIWS